MKHFLHIITKHWKKIIFITLLTVAATTTFSILTEKTVWNGTVFINIGAKQNFQEQNQTSLLENVQAADHFSESIQGWFKNPSFTKRMEERSGSGVDFSARKQEKQNLVITYKTSNEDDAKKIAKVLQENLQIEIGKYNIATGTSFQLALYDFTVGKAKNLIPIFLILGLIFGLFFSFGACSVYETITLELKQLARKQE